MSKTISHRGDDTANVIQPVVMSNARRVMVEAPDFFKPSAENKFLINQAETDDSKVVEALISLEREIWPMVDGEGDQDLVPFYDEIVSSLHECGYHMVEINNFRHWMAPDIYVVVFDHTKYWNYQDQPWADKIERIEGVYWFDNNVVTHLCSIEGNRWLECLEYRPVLKGDYSDDLRDEIEEWVRTGDHGDNSSYYTERDMENFINDEANNDRVHHYGNPQFDWNDADDVSNSMDQKLLDFVSDALRSNQVI